MNDQQEAKVLEVLLSRLGGIVNQFDNLQVRMEEISIRLANSLRKPIHPMPAPPPDERKEKADFCMNLDFRLGRLEETGSAMDRELQTIEKVV